MPIIVPSLVVMDSLSRYLHIAGRIYREMKLGLRGHIKLSEQAAIRFI